MINEPLTDGAPIVKARVLYTDGTHVDVNLLVATGSRNNVVVGAKERNVVIALFDSQGVEQMRFNTTIVDGPLNMLGRVGLDNLVLTMGQTHFILTAA